MDSVEKALRSLREALAAVREGNLVIAEIVIEEQIKLLEYEAEKEKFKPWWWP